jgi:hypothetical protein
MELDRRNRNNNMNGPSALAISSISGRGSVRMSRLRHRGPNHTMTTIWTWLDWQFSVLWPIDEPVPEHKLNISLSVHVRMCTTKSNGLNWGISWHIRGTSITTRSRYKSRHRVSRKSLAPTSVSACSRYEEANLILFVNIISIILSDPDKRPNPVPEHALDAIKVR